ncbi:hypothetical protein PRIPAC_87052 [Pristionchus pacificus]|uniref:Uncharacterized protein n=1 Tax=Pristionchus pacificus TaxID=54126 RepID=A0A2A6BMJ7_PRIPA|nr:hypothetical protein PRIPAC_87052 [Pristionchus pacificus]|eukprot:PDM67144.1 hypothetical protein PRIPAC_48561 [Pristionchus pacificus]
MSAPPAKKSKESRDEMPGPSSRLSKCAKKGADSVKRRSEERLGYVDTNCYDCKKRPHVIYYGYKICNECFDAHSMLGSQLGLWSLYNIIKIRKPQSLEMFDQLFDVLWKLSADTDQNVRSGAELLNRLLMLPVPQHMSTRTMSTRNRNVKADYDGARPDTLIFMTREQLVMDNLLKAESLGEAQKTTAKYIKKAENAEKALDALKTEYEKLLDEVEQKNKLIQQYLITLHGDQESDTGDVAPMPHGGRNAERAGARDARADAAAPMVRDASGDTVVQMGGGSLAKLCSRWRDCDRCIAALRRVEHTLDLCRPGIAA